MGAMLARSMQEEAATHAQAHEKGRLLKWEQAAYIKRQVRKLEHRSTGIIDPRTSIPLRVFDAIIALALAFTALFTPFEISFIEVVDLADSLSLTVFIVRRPDGRTTGEAVGRRRLLRSLCRG